MKLRTIVLALAVAAALSLATARTASAYCALVDPFGGGCLIEGM